MFYLDIYKILEKMQNTIEIKNLTSNNAIYQLDVANGFFIRRSDGYIVWKLPLSNKVVLPLQAHLTFDGHVIITDNNKHVVHVFSPRYQKCYYYEPSPPYTLILKDDGALVLYDIKKNPVWYTNFDKQILQQFAIQDENPDMNFWKRGFYN